MVVEIARLYAKPDMEDELRSTLHNTHVMTDAEGCFGADVFQQIEDPTCFILKVAWDSVESHQRWIASPARDEWRSLLAESRADVPSDVAHYRQVNLRGVSEPRGRN